MRTTTPRLTLRPFTTADAPALHAYLGDPEVVRFEPYGPLSAQEAETETQRRVDDPRFIAVERTEDRVLIGHVYRSLTELAAWRTWTVGYVFNPEFGRRGYATEAVRAVIDDCFRVQGAHRLTAQCDPVNVRSWQLLERLGLRREGHELRSASFSTGPDGEPVWHDAYRYAVLAEEWRG
ncbi:GNAT family protein [Cellulomonas sp. NPDC089187]|uniref:GNAT family N-acetyltransferase n=1 Tax=Cellulomonas sp. NPDC089187 TaxID=3154970 RepID=UPI0034326704